MDPTTLSAAGRMVRCAKCGHSWLQMPPNDMPQTVDLPEESPLSAAAAPMFHPRMLVRRRQASAGPLILNGLILAGLAVILALGVGYFARERIAATWPDTVAVYDLLGIRATPIGAGLTLGNVTFVLRNEDKDKVMTVEGAVTNPTPEPLPLPTLRVTLRNEDGLWLADWDFKLDRPMIDPGQALGFRTMTKNPPQAAKTLTVTFAEDEGGS
jgi:hypothetical protein